MTALSKPNILFVCCVESGGLECQVTRMVESLRRWGGVFANARVMAVKPRLGPPLTQKTRHDFARLRIEFHSFVADNPYSWKAFLNKHYAMAYAESIATEELICWLDSDLLILKAPEGLLLADNEDFAACAPDRTIGSTGPDDPFEPFWREVCKVVDLTPDDLPWVIAEQESQRIRMYLNSGVFVYRRSTGFSKFHLETTLKVMAAKISSRSAGNYFTQHTLGLSVVKQGLRWRLLPHSHNYTPILKDELVGPDLEKLKSARILHYHDAMWPAKWNTLLNMMKASHPVVSDWLSDLTPMQNVAPIPHRILSKALASWRNRDADKYTQRCSKF